MENFLSDLNLRLRVIKQAEDCAFSFIAVQKVQNLYFFEFLFFHYIQRNKGVKLTFEKENLNSYGHEVMKSNLLIIFSELSVSSVYHTLITLVT